MLDLKTVNQLIHGGVVEDYASKCVKSLLLHTSSGMQILQRFDAEAPSIAPVAEEHFTPRFLRVLDYFVSFSE